MNDTSTTVHASFTTKHEHEYNITAERVTRTSPFETPGEGGSSDCTAWNQQRNIAAAIFFPPHFRGRQADGRDPRRSAAEPSRLRRKRPRTGSGNSTRTHPNLIDEFGLVHKSVSLLVDWLAVNSFHFVHHDGCVIPRKLNTPPINSHKCSF